MAKKPENTYTQSYPHFPQTPKNIQKLINVNKKGNIKQ